MDNSRPRLRPLSGVHLAVGAATVITNSDGSFIARDLPADELTVTLVPLRSLPSGLTAPTGRVKVTHEPVQVENTTIVISNPKLLEYLVP